MAQAVVNPDDLRRFAGNLRQFNNELLNQLTVIHGQFSGLGQTWRDKEHQKFAEELESTLTVLKRSSRPPTSTSRSSCARPNASKNTCNSVERRSRERAGDAVRPRPSSPFHFSFSSFFLRSSLPLRRTDPPPREPEPRPTPMSQSADVRSIQVIRDFKVTLANFADDARNALSSSEMEIRRVRNWLTRDQVTYWQAQIKRGNEQVSMAKADLHRRRLSQQGSDAVSDTEQKEALKAAQNRLREAEEKLAKVKKWVPVLEHAITEYHATSQPLGDRLTGSLVNSMALLERMVNMLESYVATQAVSTEISMGALAPAAAPASAGASATSPRSSADGGEASAATEAAPASTNVAATPETEAEVVHSEAEQGGVRT